MLDRIISAAVVSCCVSGCVYHIDTAIPEEALYSDPTLVGTWSAGNSELGRVVITSGGGHNYRLEYSDHDGMIKLLHGRLGRLGEHTVLEVWPAFADVDDDWPTGRFLVVLDIRADEIRSWSLSRDSIGAALKSGGTEVPHLTRKGDLILTTPSSVLFAQVTSYLNRAGFLDDEDIWRRVPPR
jgi:hypothetical protein